MSPCLDITNFTVVDSVACLRTHVAGACLVTAITQVVGPGWLLATNKAHRPIQRESQCNNACLSVVITYHVTTHGDPFEQG